MQPDLSQIFGRAIPTIQVADVGAMSTGQDRYQPLVAAGIAQITGFDPSLS